MQIEDGDGGGRVSLDGEELQGLLVLRASTILEFFVGWFGRRLVALALTTCSELLRQYLRTCVLNLTPRSFRRTFLHCNKADRGRLGLG